MRCGGSPATIDGASRAAHSGSSSAVVQTAAEANNSSEDDDSATSVTELDLLLAFPVFLMQGILFWLPVALYPPLCGKLRLWLGRYYLLEVRRSLSS